jgi:hypothetical protein
VQREWASAVGSFYERKTVMKMFLPPQAAGDFLDVLVNRDPIAMRDQDKAVKEAEARRSARIREELNKKSQFETVIRDQVSE